MMWRLNFLVVMVMAITNHEFVRYYVCAMHTYWFLTVYAMLAVFAKYNHVSLQSESNTTAYFRSGKSWLKGYGNKKYLPTFYIIPCLFLEIFFTKNNGLSAIMH